MRHHNVSQFKPAVHQRRQQRQPYVVHHDFDGAAKLSTTLAHALSDVTGIDVTDTGFTLNDYVDPEALDHLFAPQPGGFPRTNGSLSLGLLGCQVVVHNTGQIVVTPPQRPPVQTRQ